MDFGRHKGFPCAGFGGIFIETGTFMGQTVVALSSHFTELHTVELSSECFEAAKLFAWKAARPIHYHLGNSISILRTILPKVSGPAVLYLDAHWSGSVTEGKDEIPLMKELGFLCRIDMGLCSCLGQKCQEAAVTFKAVCKSPKLFQVQESKSFCMFSSRLAVG